MKKLGLITTIATCASIATAQVQGWNVDFDVPGGIGAGGPSQLFGAAGPVGWWNLAPAGGASGPLVDLNNNATGVTVTNNGFGLAANVQAYTGNDELLMCDILDGASSITFNGLSNGLYNVWVYAQAPDSGAFLTDVTILGNTQTVGGAWGGSYVLGNTHSLHTNVNVAAGSLTINIAPNSGFSSVNGVQLQAVPEPGTIAAFAIGGLTLLALRRRKK